MIEVVHVRDEARARLVAEIANEYRTRFRQEAVLRVTAPVRMEVIP